MLYVYRASQFGLIPFQVLSGHLRLLVIALDGPALLSRGEHVSSLA